MTLTKTTATYKFAHMYVSRPATRGATRQLLPRNFQKHV